MMKKLRRTPGKHRAPNRGWAGLRLRPAAPALGAALFLLGGVLTLSTLTLVGPAVAAVGLLAVAATMPPQPQATHELSFFTWDEAAA